MDYRKYGDTVYARMDRDDEIISGILCMCKESGIKSATFSGIGGCKEAEIQTFIPEAGAFETETINGMLELVTLMGNIITDENGEFYYHAHAMFSYLENGQHKMAAGHLKSAKVLYTAEIELRPVTGGFIGRRYDAETGTGFWCFD